MDNPSPSRTFAAVSPRRGGTQRSETMRTLAPAAAATMPAATSRGGMVSWPSWGGATVTRPLMPMQGIRDWARADMAMPISSSVVTPFQRSVTRNDATRASLSEPLRIAVNACDASSRERLRGDLGPVPKEPMRRRRTMREV